jgi:hypothetical protein
MSFLKNMFRKGKQPSIEAQDAADDKASNGYS